MSARIWVVDDNPLIVGLLALKLQAAGHESRVFAAGEDLLVALGTAREAAAPDLLLLDLQMPGLSGLDTLRRLRDDRLIGRTPVLVLTGSEQDADIRAARDLGAAGFLTKPFDTDVLLGQIGRVLAAPDIVWLDDYHCVRSAGGGERR